MDSFALACRPPRIFVENVIPHLTSWMGLGLPCALVTLVHVEGSSPRKVGSQMGVNAQGACVGAISSGCAQAAIVEEAVNALTTRASKLTRYGAGSPYIDVVLPCGSGIDVHIDVSLTRTMLEELHHSLVAREEMSLITDLDNVRPTRLQKGRAISGVREFTRTYTPPVKLLIAGRGAELDYLARFAYDLEWDLVVASPDQNALTRLSDIATATQHLTRPQDFDASGIDPRTAVVLLFHDHEWEPALLARCADAAPFFIGAMGSRRTHQQRLDLLTMAGCPVELRGQIVSPVGLDIGASNPPEIALSIGAQILARARNLP